MPVYIPPVTFQSSTTTDSSPKAAKSRVIKKAPYLLAGSAALMGIAYYKKDTLRNLMPAGTPKVNVPPPESLLSKTLKLGQSTASTTLKALVGLGLLYQIPKVNGLISYIMGMGKIANLEGLVEESVKNKVGPRLEKLEGLNLAEFIETTKDTIKGFIKVFDERLNIKFTE